MSFNGRLLITCLNRGSGNSRTRSGRSFGSGIRLRAQAALPALMAARFASRIATICLACFDINLRRLVDPPMLPM
jgi:hypothetical protein